MKTSADTILMLYWDKEVLVALYEGTRASTCFFPTLFLAEVVMDHNSDGHNRKSTVIDGGLQFTKSSLFYIDKCVYSLNLNLR